MDDVQEMSLPNLSDDGVQGDNFGIKLHFQLQATVLVITT
jgi:hypothetical protein